MTTILTDYRSSWRPPRPAGIMTDALREALAGLREDVERISRERSATARVEAARHPDARLLDLDGIAAELQPLATLPYTKPVRIVAQLGLRFLDSKHLAAAHRAGWRLEDVFGVPIPFMDGEPAGFVYATSFLKVKATLVGIDREGAKFRITDGRRHDVRFWRPTPYNSGRPIWLVKAKLPTLDE